MRLPRRAVHRPATLLLAAFLVAVLGGQTGVAEAAVRPATPPAATISATPAPAGGVAAADTSAPALAARQTPVSATATTAQGSVDPAAFGAHPDDDRDDVAGLHAALDAAAGRPVVLAVGVYQLATPLLLPSGSHLSGGGADSVLAFGWLRSADGSAYVRDANDGADRDTAIVVRDLTIRGPHDGTPWGPSPAPAVALRLRRVDHAEVRRVRFDGVPGIAAAFQGGRGGRFVDNVVDASGRDGFYATSFVEPLRDLVVEGNRFDQVGDDGVAVHRDASAAEPQHGVPIGITVRDNVIRGHERVYTRGAGRGILVRDAQDVTLTGNDIASTFAAGVHVSGEPGLPARRIVVDANTVRAAGAAGDGSQPAAGVWIADVAEVRVRDNVIADGTDHGVYARGATGLVVQGNAITTNGTSARHVGIDLDGAEDPVDDAHVTDNTVRDSAGPGIRLWQTGRVHVRGNHVRDGNGADSSDPLQGAGIVVHTSAPVSVVANTSAGARQTFGVYLGWRVRASRVAGNRVAGNRVDGVGWAVPPDGVAAANAVRAQRRAASRGGSAR